METSSGVRLLHHTPGTLEGASLLRRLANTVSALSGARVSLASVEEPVVEPGENVYILLLSRGGHYHEALEAARRAGARAMGPIPHWLTALWLAGKLEGCSRPGLVYWPAKRLQDEKLADLQAIAMALERLTGSRPGLVARGSEAQGYDCLAPLTLMPSRRILAPYRGAGARLVEGSLLGDQPGLLASWILSTLTP